MDIDLPSEFFTINPTLNAVEQAINPRPFMPSLKKSTVMVEEKERSRSLNALLQPQVPSIIDFKKATVVVQEIELELSADPPRHPRANSILLQGNPRTARKTLFLFPDGSGSVTSYANLPLISPDLCVYGLICPYLKTPEGLTTRGLHGLTARYLVEIRRRRRPQSPYSFGGWSAGGICAYDAALQVVRDGGQIQHLILLDSPRPINLEKLPPRFYHFLDSLGLFGAQGTAPEWLFRHFLAFIDALDAYTPVPFPAHVPLQTHILWATDGVCKDPGDRRPEPHADDPHEMRWLLENRTDFGPNEWDVLVGTKDLTIEMIAGANHFSMLEGRNAAGVADFIARAMK